jgi:hypothetical protein
MDNTKTIPSTCPACRSNKIERINQNSLNLTLPTHICQSCGVKLKAHLDLKTTFVTVAIGLGLAIFYYYVLFEVTKSYTTITEGERGIGLLVLTLVTFGFCKSSLFKSTEYKLWSIKT